VILGDFVASDSNLGRSLGGYLRGGRGVTWSWCESESFAGVEVEANWVRSVAGRGGFES